MNKRVLAVLVLLFVLIAGVWAGESLLRRSILSCTYEELVRMCRSYGLDSTLGEEALRSSLLEYFGLDGASASTSSSGGSSAGSSAVSPAGKAASIRVENAEQMYSSDSVLVLSGNVKIVFSSEGSTATTDLMAQKMVFDLDSKVLEASGDVVMVQGDYSKTFTGQVISLQWDDLDIVVSDGRSILERKNSTGSAVNFIMTGQEISYDNSTSGIFFTDGTVATYDDDPYWSITASKLAFAGSDLFVDSAVFRLGRVPVFYFPVFFYPGTKLSFNPAMGLSSDRGAFLNTTYEVYGSYPSLGLSGKTEEGNISGSILSLLSEEDDSVLIPDGLYYRALGTGEKLSDTETRARNTGSYLAVFADVYENLGLVLGFDTKNVLLDKSLKLNGFGAIGYNASSYSGLPRLRYTADLDFTFNRNRLTLSAKLPVFSDPYVRQDFLNRNTVFGIDSLFGSKQNFPTVYSSQTTYTWALNSSWSASRGNYSFRLNSLKADIDYKLVSTLADGRTVYTQQFVEGSLPYLSISSSGTFFSFSSKGRTETKTTGYSNDLAESFRTELEGLNEEGQAEDGRGEECLEGSNGEAAGSGAAALDLKAYSGPNVSLSSTTSTSGASLKSGYTFSQSLDNTYKEENVHESFYTKISGSLYVNGSAPGSWFSFSETLKPQLNYSENALSKSSANKVTEANLVNVVSASIPKIGITYNLTQKLYNYYSKETLTSSESSSRLFEWTGTDVTVHNISLSRNLGYFTFGMMYQMKPLVEKVKPSVVFKDSGLTVKADYTATRNEDVFENDATNLDVSYSMTAFTFSVENDYDFSRFADTGSRWHGYSMKQKASWKPLKGLSISQNSDFKEKFEIQAFSFTVAYAFDNDFLDLDTSAFMSFAGKTFEEDELRLNIGLDSQDIVMWKGRLGFNVGTDISFVYDFQNPYRTSFTYSLDLGIAVAEFMDLGLKVSGANKSFYRYFVDEVFSFKEMMEDLGRSFDFFGTGRHSTGFNLSSFKLSMVHYMRDWNLYIDAQGSLTTKYSGKYEWVPTVTVCMKWNVLPELKTEGNWDSWNKEWN